VLPCTVCGTPTLLRVKGTPLCVKCDDEREGSEEAGSGGSQGAPSKEGRRKLVQIWTEGHFLASRAKLEAAPS
jgi:hypothetical protein